MPSTIVGMTRYGAIAIGFQSDEPIGRIPLGGSQCNRTPNSMMSISANQKCGIENPVSERIVPRSSSRLYGRVACATPMSVPKTRPKMMAMMTQPMESSQMAEATMICPRLRRVNPISRTIAATILIDEMDKAVPRNRDVSRR